MPWPGGRLFLVDITDPSQTLSRTEVLTIVAGDIITAVSYQHNGVSYVLFGTTSGVIARFDTAAKKVANLLLVTAGSTAQQITALGIDHTPARGPVAYYSTSTYTAANYNTLIGRVNLNLADDFVSYDEIKYGATLTSIRGMIVHPENQILIVGAGSIGNLVRVSLTCMHLQSIPECEPS